MTMLGRILNICCALILASGALAAQELQITPNNRTIYVTAEDEVTLEPAIAIINFGYQTFGPDQQAAMNDLSQKSKAIAKTLVDARDRSQGNRNLDARGCAHHLLRSPDTAGGAQATRVYGAGRNGACE